MFPLADLLHRMVDMLTWHEESHRVEGHRIIDSAFAVTAPPAPVDSVGPALPLVLPEPPPCPVPEPESAPVQP